MQLARILPIAALLALPAAPVGSQVDTQKYPDLKKVFTADTLPLVGYAQVSPDGRWIVMEAPRGVQGSALFLGRMGTSEITRLTTDGYVDEGAMWFPTGDRIVFRSNRPARNGSKSLYGMVLDIDPRTGAARGAPRQVTLDSVLVIQPTPDGQSLAFATAGRPNKLLIVPAAGGTARTLLSTDGRAVSMGVSPDGRSVFYRHFDANNRSFIERLSLAPGATPERLVVEAMRPERYLLPADQRFVLTWSDGGTEWKEDVHTVQGRLVGTHTAPKELRCPWYTVNGWGWMCIEDTGAMFTTRVQPMGGGGSRVISTANNNGLVAGWWPDGSAIISVAERRAAGAAPAYVADITPLAGGTPRSFPLARASGFVDVVGYELAYRVPVRDNAGAVLRTRLVAIDLRTGGTRALSENAAQRSIQGPGGDAVAPDRHYWAETDSQWVSVFADAPSAPRRLVRRFAASTPLTLGIHVHGERVVWAETRTDSVVVFIADNATAAPRRIAAFRATVREVSHLAWSHDGRRVAIAHHLAGRSAAVSIFEVTASGAVPNPRVLMLDGDLEALAWDRGDAALTGAMLSQAGTVELVRISLTSGQRLVVNRDDPRDVPVQAVLSPDGRNLAYNVMGRTGGSTIYTFEARRLVQQVPPR